MNERDCTNCKHHTSDGCSSWDCEFEAKDLISRADAIEAVASITMSIHLSDVICDKLLALPSADAVSREEYEDIIKDYRKQYENMNNEIADLEAKLSAEAEWIPCSERLPSEDGRYLVCMDWEYDNMEVLRWADGWNCHRDYDGKISRESEIDGEDIVAWMPLPMPYREDGE